MSAAKVPQPGFDLPVAGGTIHVSPGPSAGGETSIRLSFAAEVEIPPEIPPGDPDDGFDDAPTGDPQMPRLLDGYVARPAWRVAGVDYRVGWHMQPAMKPVAVPGYIEVNDGVVTLVADGTVLSNMDLTGMNVVVRGHGCRVTDCLFRVANSRSWYCLQVYGDHCVVDYNEFDGSGETFDQSALVAVYGSDPAFRYNSVHDFAQHVVEMVQPADATTTLDYRFNLIRRGGTGPGAHLNILQWSSGKVDEPLVAYNTFAQEKAQAAGEAVQMYGNSAGWSCTDGTVFRNVFISSGGDLAHDDPAVSYFLNLTAAAGRADENHFDLRSAYGWLYPGSGWSAEGNVDMVTGNLLEK